jgi:glycosyltransferase involved in cell wall biosynthesis
MAPTNRLLIQVVAQLMPAQCGVSDHAILLAQELETTFGIKSAFVILNSTEPCNVQLPKIYCAPSQLLEAALSLSNGQAGTLLVHLSGYGFSTDGAPTLLADALANVRASGKFKIIVYFHELFATGMPWRSAFWYSHRQRRALREIAEESNLLVTNCRYHAAWLEREPVRQPGSSVEVLPMFSNVGEALERTSTALRAPSMVVFGLAVTRQRAYKALSDLGSMLKDLGIEEVLDIGPPCDAPLELSGIPVRSIGSLAAADLDRLFSKTMFGFVPHSSFVLAKSGIFAGYCAHGVIPVLAESFSGEADGLMDGVHLVSPQTAKSAQASGLDHCSAAAWHWYREHRVRVHAELYAQHLAQPTVQEESTEIAGALGSGSSQIKPLTAAVCIGTFNQSQYLKGCIESVLAQSYPIREIWVSDDASTDNTPEVMQELCQRYPTVRYYRQPANLGITGNFSWALSQPSTDLIVRLDSDDSLEPDFVATLAELMRQHPEAGYAHGDVYEIDGDGAKLRTRRLHRGAIYECPEDTLRRSTLGYRVAANCILYRSAALKEANYYYPNLSWKACEDWDLCLRIAIRGWGNVHAATPLANYRVWDDAQHARFKRKVTEVENMIELYNGTLEPEYLRRGWDTAILRNSRRERAVGFTDVLDSALFSAIEREKFKLLLRKLGSSFSLSLAILLADMGFNPVFRSMRRTKVRVKYLVKSCH